ncbi:MAG: ABC transporter substrate-binding protein [Spirochaetales bacterium]
MKNIERLLQTEGDKTKERLAGEDCAQAFQSCRLPPLLPQILRPEVRKILFSLLLLVGFLAGICPLEARGRREVGPVHPTYVVYDSYQRPVQLSRVPERIVSCAPNLTEILFFIGEGKRLVGRTDWCNWPEEVTQLPSVGGLQDPSIEKILSLQPDLVVASTHFQKETLQMLETLRIPVFVGVVHREYAEVYELIIKVGTLVQQEEKARRKARELAEQVEALRTLTEPLSPKPTVYYMISFGDEGDYTAGKDTHISQLIRWAGGINIADDIVGWQYSREALLLKNPNIILVGKGRRAVEQLKALSPYRNLKAVKEGRVYEINNDLLDRMGPRNLEGLRELVRLFHPELKLDQAERGKP